MNTKYFPGLNSLRFIAAFFVVISHAAISLDKIGIQAHPHLPFLARGGDAVEFFFTLSGFLITYLLLNEVNNTGTVSLKNFYLKRVLRIWPPYFIVVGIGFFILGVVYPWMYNKPYFSFSIIHGLLMFIFFVPNYATKNYPVGLLHPLWSIGVEEQFYLFWPLLVKLMKKTILQMIVCFIILSTLLYFFIAYDLIKVSDNWKSFFLTQKFYAMAIGSLFGYIMYYKSDSFGNSFFSSKSIRLFLIAFILWHFVFHNVEEAGIPFKVFMCFVYGLLILNVAGNPGKRINLEQPFLMYLGAISYGIYMYHMLVDYCLRLLFPKLNVLHLPKAGLIMLYYFLLVSITLVVAAFSYRYIEKYFLSLKDRLHAKPQK